MPKATAFLAIALPLAAAGTALGSDRANPASASLSTDRAGARPVALTLSLHTELQCGRLTAGVVTIKLPRRALVPPAIPGAAVLVSGKPAGRVTVSGHSLTISMPPPRGVATCDSISIGVAKIVLSRAAGLGNPKPPGTYTVTVTHRSETFSAPLTIR